MHRRIAVMVAAVVLALGATACGDVEPSEPVTGGAGSAHVRAANVVCRRMHREIADAMGAGNKAIEERAMTRREAADQAVAAVSAARRQAAQELEAIEVPEALQERRDRLVATMDRVTEMLPSAAELAAQTSKENDAATKLEADAAKLAKQLGLKGCP